MFVAMHLLQANDAKHICFDAAELNNFIITFIVYQKRRKLF